MKSNKLKKENKLTKEPNNREPQSINFSNAFLERSKTIDSSIENMTTKSKTDIELLQSLKIGRKEGWQKLTKYLEQLHRQFKVKPLTIHLIVLFSFLRNSTEHSSWLKLVSAVI